MTQVTGAGRAAIQTASSKLRGIIIPACTAVAAALGWVTFYLLHSLPRLGPDDRQMLFYAGGHTSTWWSVPTFALAALTSLALTGYLGRLAWRSSRVAVPTAVRVVVAVLAVAVWVCGAVFLALLCLVLWFTAAAEGTQQTAHGPDGASVLVTQGGLWGDGYGVWLPVGEHSYRREPGESAVDLRRGPCAVSGEVGMVRVVTCGDVSQTLTG